MLEIKNTVTEMKNAFYGLKKKLDTTEERIHDLKDMSIETSEVDGQRKKKRRLQLETVKL